MIKNPFALFVLVFFSFNAISQNPVLPTLAKDRDVNNEFRNEVKSNSLYANYPVNNIGPTIMSGRVSDIEVNPQNSTEFYVAYASGGLWYTNNNGITFSPKFDDQAVITIGDIAVDWENNTIYVGTGEVNSSRSSYAGNGIYKSTDSGDTWSYLGLPESHHIGRIVIDKSNSTRLWVAVLGHLYSPNTERGIYTSSDGGATWKHTLYVNENSGAVDLIQDPVNNNVLYSAMWQRERRAWNFVEAGAGSGIYKSNDYGQTWTKITTPESGFPTGEGVGRIGLSITYQGNVSHLFVILDNYNRRAKKDKETTDKLKKDDFKTMDHASLLSMPDSILSEYLVNNNFPKKYDAKKVKQLIENEDILPNALAEYLEDANSLLFDTDVIGAEVYRSIDGGKTFSKTHEGFIDRLYNSYGYYFGQIRVEPNNPSTVYIMGVPILRSDDAGETWTNINGDNVHVDHHDLWINPNNTRHIINGNDGGVNLSYDKGENWIKCNTPAVGQFYAINVDNLSPYNIYVGAQDNGVWVGTSNYSPSTRWHQTGEYPYKMLLGGDGMQIEVDNRNADIVYTGFQFGNYFRINKSTGKREYITPKHELGERPYRWNWQSPILLSSHNQDILYMGANKLLRSFNQGDDFTEISEDLTFGGKKGDVAYGTLTAIDESKFTFGKIVVGSDDGKIHLTLNGGSDWIEIGKDLPPHLWVSRVQFSNHDSNTMYAALNGYRWDDFTAYLYKSTDNGKTWQDIAGSLPSDPINVIKEDPDFPDILYIGTDHGLFVSTNGGITFQPFADEIPNVPIHDVVIQKKMGHLLIATHGRSVYKIDLAYIREVYKEKPPMYLFDLPNIEHNSNWGEKSTVYAEWNRPTLNFLVFSDGNNKGKYLVKDSEGLVLYEETISLMKGINSFEYNLFVKDDAVKKYSKNLKERLGKKVDILKKDDGNYYLKQGEYKLEVQIGEKFLQNNFIIE